MNVGQPRRNTGLLHISRCEPVTVSADAMTAMTHVTDRCHCPEWQTAIPSLEDANISLVIEIGKERHSALNISYTYTVFIISCIYFIYLFIYLFI